MRELAMALTLVWAGLAFAFAQTATADELTIETATGSHVFLVETATTAQERAVGLMNRTYMARDAGMLFDFGETRAVAMWMRSTFIPLDMLYIRADGTVAGIHENAIPHDETALPSPEPVRFVLELNGGVAAQISARPGDRVDHPLIDALR